MKCSPNSWRIGKKPGKGSGQRGQTVNAVDVPAKRSSNKKSAVPVHNPRNVGDTGSGTAQVTVTLFGFSVGLGHAGRNSLSHKTQVSFPGTNAAGLPR